MTVAEGYSQKPVHTESFKSNGNLSAKQFYFVKMTANPREIAICTAVTDKPIGILLNTPDAAGKAAEVMVIGRSKVSSDVALSEGNSIGCSADGQADVKTETTGGDTTQYVVGTVIAASGAAGVMAEVIINCANPNFVQV